VGKTELARVLARFLFDDPDALIRIDMSEYMEKFSVSRLIGAPPGYVGHEEGGQLTEKVRRKPYSVVLLDEIEKAHPDVFNILLQVLDDGQLTDSLRRKVDFKNTVLIMTSNLGARQIKGGRSLGFSERSEESTYTGMKQTIMDELKKSFNPEFLNRIDEAIVFHPLERPQMAQITAILLEQVADRLRTNGIRVTLDNSVVELLIEKGFDVTLGARPLKRSIQKLIEDPLSEHVLRGQLKDGSEVVVSRQGDELTFSS
jgi:ATP-dependent Clp protease ATP-binding subunit ClpC